MNNLNYYSLSTLINSVTTLFCFICLISNRHKKSLKFKILTVFFSIIIWMTGYFYWHNILIYLYLNIFTNIYAITITYLIIKYNLMDINLASRKLVRYEKVSQKVLKAYQNTYQVQIIEEFKRLAKIKNIDILCQHSKRLLCRFLNIHDIKIYVYSDKEKDKASFVCKSHKIDIAKNIEIAEDDSLISYMTQIDGIILRNKLMHSPRECRTKEIKGALETIEKLKAEVIIPLLDKRLLGLITIGPGKSYTKEDFLILEFLSDKLTTTISNILTYDESILDMLTGTFNKKYMYIRMEEEVINSLKNSKCFVFMMIDEDGFKYYNDTFGHQEGDLLIALLADIFRDTIRPTDVIFHLNADEFAILLPGMTEEQYQDFKKRFDENFNNHENMINLLKRFDKKIKISYGAAFFDGSVYEKRYNKDDIVKIIDNILENADQEMYRHKQTKTKRYPIGFRPNNNK